MQDARLAPQKSALHGRFPGEGWHLASWYLVVAAAIGACVARRAIASSDGYRRYAPLGLAVSVDRRRRGRQRRRRRDGQRVSLESSACRRRRRGRRCGRARRGRSCSGLRSPGGGMHRRCRRRFVATGAPIKRGGRCLDVGRFPDSTVSGRGRRPASESASRARLEQGHDLPRRRRRLLRLHFTCLANPANTSGQQGGEDAGGSSTGPRTRRTP